MPTTGNAMKNAMKATKEMESRAANSMGAMQAMRAMKKKAMKVAKTDGTLQVWRHIDCKSIEAVWLSITYKLVANPSLGGRGSRVATQRGTIDVIVSKKDNELRCQLVSLSL